MATFTTIKTFVESEMDAHATVWPPVYDAPAVNRGNASHLMASIPPAAFVVLPKSSQIPGFAL